MCDHCIERLARINPQVLQAVTNNRQAFLELMGKIRLETEDKLIQLQVIDAQGDEKEQPDHNELVLVESLCIALYLTSFFRQEMALPEALTPLITHVWEEGARDGHAYNTVRQMPRH